MKTIRENKVFMEYPEPFIRLQKDTKSVNMPYLHFHDGYEIYIMIKGKVDYILADDTFELSDACFILINPFVIHKKISNTEKYSTFLVNFNLNTLKECFTDEAIKNILQPFIQLPYGTLSADQIKSISRIAQYMCNTESQVDIALGIAELLNIVSHASPLKSTHPVIEGALDDAVYKYTANNLDKKITLDELSAQLYMSKQSLTGVFRKSYSTSPIYFVKQVKMNFARSMLQYPEFSVDTICKYCGFNSVSYFSKTFKTIFGQTPSEYRRSILKNE